MTTMNCPENVTHQQPNTMPLPQSTQDSIDVSQETRQLAASTAEQLEVNLKSDWDPIQLATLLHTLTTHDLPLDIVTKYRLGRLVKSIKKKAQEKDNQPIADVSDQIMSKWRDLLPNKDNHASSRSPTPSPVSSPKNQERATLKSDATSLTTASSSSSSQQQPAPFRLALQKDPTPKAKAITNTSFFDTLNGTSSYSNTVRPSFSRDRSAPQHVSLQSLLNTMKRDSPPTSLTSTGTVTTRKRTFEIGASVPPTPSSPVSAPEPVKKIRTRRVRFRPDHQLVSVREYEKDPEEWNFDQMKMDHARDMNISEGQALSQANHPHQGQSATQNARKRHEDPRVHNPQTAWYPPIRIDVPANCALPWPKQSGEIVTQQRREQLTAPYNYENMDGRLDSPAEPAEEHVHLRPPTNIPLFEIDEEQINQQQQQQDLAQEEQQKEVDHLQRQHEQQVQKEQQGIQTQQTYIQQVPPQYPMVTAAALPTTPLTPTTPVHLLHPYQPSSSSPTYLPMQQQQAKMEPSYAGYNTQVPFQQQYQPPSQQPQQFQPQQFPPQPQPTAEQLNILLNSGLLGAISDIVRNLPAPGLAGQGVQSFGQQYMSNPQQPAPQQSYTIPIQQQYQPQYASSSEQQPFNRPPINKPNKRFKNNKFNPHQRPGGLKNKKKKRTNVPPRLGGHTPKNDHPSKGPGGGGVKKTFGGPKRPCKYAVKPGYPLGDRCD